MYLLFLRLHKKNLEHIKFLFGDSLNSFKIFERYFKRYKYFYSRYCRFIDWNFISNHLELSEEFIKEFKDHLDWENIFIYQNISYKFITKFKNRVDYKKHSFSVHRYIDKLKREKKKKLIYENGEIFFRI